MTPLNFVYFMTICCLLKLVPEKIMQNTHISKVIALFVSTTVWQSGGDAPYCKTAITACWVLPKLPSGRWAARFPLVPLLPFTSPLHCLSSPLSLFSSPVLSVLVFLSPTAYLFPPRTLLSTPASSLFSTFVFLYILLHPGLDHTLKQEEVWRLKGEWDEGKE